MHSLALTVVAVTTVVAYGYNDLNGGNTCTASGNARADCYPWETESLDKNKCMAHGCCWDNSQDGVPWCFYPTLPAPSAGSCSAVTVPSRLDCHPEPNASQDQCESRGCCWDASVEEVEGLPACFFPHTEAYSTDSGPKTTATGWKASVSLADSSFRGPYAKDASNLDVEAWFETKQRLRVRISDPSSPNRWEVPGVVQTEPPTQAAEDRDYDARISKAPFGLEVVRASNGATLFNSTPPAVGEWAPLGPSGSFSGLIWENQFIEISMQVASKPLVYGLGEHIVPLLLPSTAPDGAGQTYTLLSRDQGTPVHNSHGGTNLYASHPFMLFIDEESGDAHGVFLLNSNAMEAVLQPGALTLRTTGGVLDFYFFTGPSPAEVIAQYHEVIGRPYMIPRWSLGFHLCRWGYDNMSNVEQVVQGMQHANLPQDVQWFDIDHFASPYLDFTYDPKNFAPEEVNSFFTTQFQKNGLRHINIVDPGISDTQKAGSYPAFDDGVDMDIFLRNSSGSYLQGKVWPGFVYFPDWLHPNTTDWWTQQFQAYKKLAPIAGSWTDMNEVSNFCVGQCFSDDDGTEVKLEDYKPKEVGGVRKIQANGGYGDEFDPEYPPFLPGRLGGLDNIATKTVYFSAVHWNGTLEYDVHNMFGHGELIATHKALHTVLGERFIVVSRSTFPSSGVWASHWLGDNTASWDDLVAMIPGILNFQLFGIPLVGADTCGFGGTSNAELCTRWMQASAIVAPFYRNHNTIGAKAQEPFVWGEPYTSVIRTAMNLRYSLIPYIYTRMHLAHAVGGAVVAEPLFVEFSAKGSNNPVQYIDTQIMLGDALMSAPVIEQGVTSQNIFFPEGEVFYDWHTGMPISIPSKGGNVSFQVKLDTLPIFARGGYIVATQEPGLSTVLQAGNAYNLTVALGSTSKSTGQLFLDDGVTFDTYEHGKYTWANFTATGSPGASSGTISSSIGPSAYTVPSGEVFTTFRIFGVTNSTSKCTFKVDGKDAKTISLDQSAGVLVASLDAKDAPAVSSAFNADWKC